jgi:hypothetical protein
MEVWCVEEVRGSLSFSNCTFSSITILESISTLPYIPFSLNGRELNFINLAFSILNFTKALFLVEATSLLF